MYEYDLQFTMYITKSDIVHRLRQSEIKAIDSTRGLLDFHFDKLSARSK